MGDPCPFREFPGLPGGAECLRERLPGENGRILLFLARTLAVVFLGMSFYEILKICLYPGMDLWESQNMTVGFVSVAAVGVAFFVARKNYFIRKSIERERQRRIEAEVARYTTRKQPRNFTGAGKPIHE
ncbi:MAG: hypothetical protein NTY64_08340 [Deltaproteobacteria bacterium]|nr:hypothetical protein [Deltaproteobacteria bacterium]